MELTLCSYIYTLQIRFRFNSFGQVIVTEIERVEETKHYQWRAMTSLCKEIIRDGCVVSGE